MEERSKLENGIAFLLAVLTAENCQRKNSEKKGMKEMDYKLTIVVHVETPSSVDVASSLRQKQRRASEREDGRT